MSHTLTNVTQLHPKTCLTQDSHKVSGISRRDPGSHSSDRPQTWPRRDQHVNHTISNDISDKSQTDTHMPLRHYFGHSWASDMPEASLLDPTCKHMPGVPGMTYTNVTRTQVET